MRAKFGSNSFGYSRTVEPIKKPLSIELKGFFIFHRIAPNRILVGWRQLNKINKLLFMNNKNIIKKLGIQTGIQIMCCWAGFLVGFGGENGSSTQESNSRAREFFLIL
jgi:hypothetical protein